MRPLRRTVKFSHIRELSATAKNDQNHRTLIYKEILKTF